MKAILLQHLEQRYVFDLDVILPPQRKNFDLSGG